MVTFARRAMSVAFALTALTAAGCRRPAGQQVVLTKDQEQQIAENVLSAPPADLQNKSDTKFEDKLTLLGYDIKGEPKKGGTFDLVMYYRVDQPVQGDWKIFVHLEAPGKRRAPFDHYGVGGLYPVGSWKKGEIVRDVVQIQVPSDWNEGDAQILIGFFDWGLYNTTQGDRRLKVASPGALKVLDDGRVLVTTVKLDGAAAAPGGAGNERAPMDMRAVAALAATLSEYNVHQTSAAPTIDGKDDDAIWQSAPSIQVSRQPDGQPLAGNIRTTARLAWDSEALYLTARTRDSDVRNAHTANDSTLWEGDNIELFLRLPDQNGKYVELQIAPNGARFDAQFTGPRTPKWEEASKFESGITHAVQVDGQVNADGEDRGFTVEAKIPWKGLGLAAAPAIGTVLEANIYRIDDKGTHDIAHMGVWAPVGNDFHKLDGAGKLKLIAAPSAAAAPQAAPAVRPAP